MAESKEKYVARTIEELLRSSKNGMLTRPHLKRIFADAERNFPKMGKIPVDFKHLEKKKVLINMGHLYDGRGMAVVAYSNPENHTRALKWLHKELKLAEDKVTIETVEASPYVVTTSMSKVFGGVGGANTAKPRATGEGTEECGGTPGPG